jgi:DNA-damage-inducible protein J
MKTITIQTRIDTNLKKNAENILSSIGLDITSAIRLFLTQCVVQRRLPFQAVAPEEPNEETLAAMQEAENIASGKVKSKGYDDVDEMIEDILYAADEEPDYNK